jgi:aldose 1-epimerase
MSSTASALGERLELVNGAGLRLEAMGYGGAITRLEAPDRDGRPANVVLAYDALEGYVADRSYVGTLIGRFANRIGRGRFALDGREHRLPVNDGPNHLHGGPEGFHKRAWRIERGSQRGAAVLQLTRLSPDGEAGYPGNLMTVVSYRWESPATLDVTFAASSDASTPVSLTQHSYFNLAGHGTILDHVLQIEADEYTPTDDALLPTGGSRPVAGTRFDFRAPRPIAEAYDLNFVLRPEPGLRRAARVSEPPSGRTLTVYCTAPALQLYTGNALGSFQQYGGFCLEPQQFPDAPNHPEFPDAILRPGQEYRSRMRFEFGTTTGA